MKNSISNLSNGQKQQVVDLFTKENLSYSKISSITDISTYNIKKILVEYNIPLKVRKGKLPDIYSKKEEIIDLYVNQNKSVRQIVNIYHSSSTTIRAILGEHIRSMGVPRKYTVNSNYFSIIDTEEKAYWLGVFFADGNITKEGECKQIRFNTIDKDWLSIFISAINYSGTYHIETHKKYNKDIYCLTVGDDTLHDDLNTLGCIPNKTKVITFPNISENLIPHFIRGYFDGDGSVGIYKNASNNNYYTLRSSFCTGSEQFMVQLANKLPCHTKTIQKRKDSNLWVLVFSVKDSIRLYNYMYKDATVWLHRKRDKFEKYIKERYSTTIISPQIMGEGIV